MFARILSQRLPRLSFFLFGPRQTGKSTMLKALPSVLLIDLLDPEEQLAFVKTPMLLRDRVLAAKEISTVVIDEIQKAPKLLDVVHLLMEQDPRLRFIMSGSSARKLRHGAANLLGGRAIYQTLHPLVAKEMEDTFNLPSVLAYGSLPRIWTLLCDGEEALVQDLLKAYVITYLREEVAAEALVRNLQGFQQFLDVAAAQYAQQINFSGVSRDCQVAAATVREYYTILEDTLMGFFVRPFSRGVRKRMSLAPRFYFFDNGVTRALNGHIRSTPNPLERGRLFEQWFVQEIYRLNAYKNKEWTLSFWRTSHGAEVDLLVCQGDTPMVAIECKHKIHLSKSDLTGLASFRKSFPKIPCFVTAPVKQPQKLSFADVLPPLQMFDWLDNL